MKLIPAIIPQSEAHLRQVSDLVLPFADEIQIDFVDGLFAGVPSWPFTESGDFSAVSSACADLATKHRLEFDLMVREPSTFLPYIAPYASRIIFHYGSAEDMQVLFSVRSERTMVGLALQNDVPIDILDSYRAKIDFVQCMGIAKIGVQGNPFDHRVVDRIREIRREYPDLPISIDGGVTMFTISLLKEAGVTRFVSGSAIVKAEDPNGAYQEMLNLLT